MYETVFEVDHHHPQQEFSETECVALLTEVVGSSLIHHLFSCLKKSERVVVYPLAQPVLRCIAAHVFEEDSSARQW